LEYYLKGGPNRTVGNRVYEGKSGVFHGRERVVGIDADSPGLPGRQHKDAGKKGVIQLTMTGGGGD